jgi:hypothetical protein
MIALFSACMDRTEMVSGKYPSSEYVTVNPSLMGTNNAHGVRQVPAFEACASAPGGFEWIITVEVGDGASKSRLGMFAAEQPASARLHAAAAINAIDRGPAFRILQFCNWPRDEPDFRGDRDGQKNRSRSSAAGRGHPNTSQRDDQSAATRHPWWPRAW